MNNFHRIKPHFYLAFLLLTCFVNVDAQVQLEVDPALTGSNIQEIHTPHMVMYNNAVHMQNKLVIFIPGTGASARAGMDLQKSLRDLGFHVIGLDYNNKVITTACTESEDAKCFDYYRQEIVFGTPVSDKTEVDSANSIYNRVYKLLHYLVENDRKGKWDTYISGDTIRWNKIIVAGHSQGAGHAAYLAKNFKLAKAVMLSGPQDYFSKLDRPAIWLSSKGKTPTSRLYAFLHKKDPFNCSWQIAGNTALRKNLPDTASVKPDMTVSRGHILLTDIETKSPHGASLQQVFANVWKYLFLDK